MYLLKIFGRNLKKYRIAANKSQEKLAEDCNLHRTYISDVERFQRNISLGNVQKIADALDVEPYKLLIKGDEEPE